MLPPTESSSGFMESLKSDAYQASLLAASPFTANSNTGSTHANDNGPLSPSQTPNLRAYGFPNLSVNTSNASAPPIMAPSFMGSTPTSTSVTYTTFPNSSLTPDETSPRMKPISSSSYQHHPNSPSISSRLGRKSSQASLGTVTSTIATNNLATGVEANHPDLPALITSREVSETLKKYNTLLNSASKYREALLQVSAAAAEFGASLEDAARCKGAGSSEEALLSAGGLHYLVSNHQQILAKSIQRNFEVPVKKQIVQFQRTMATNEETFKTQLKEKSRLLKRQERENLIMSKKRIRNLAVYRNSLLELTSQIDDIDRLKYEHFIHQYDIAQNTSLNILSYAASVVRAEVEIYEGIARKGWSGGGLDDLISAGSDPFGPSEEEDGEGNSYDDGYSAHNYTIPGFGPSSNSNKASSTTSNSSASGAGTKKGITGGKFGRGIASAVQSVASFASSKEKPSPSKAEQKPFKEDNKGSSADSNYIYDNDKKNTQKNNPTNSDKSISSFIHGLFPTPEQNNNPISVPIVAKKPNHVRQSNGKGIFTVLQPNHSILPSADRNAEFRSTDDSISIDDDSYSSPSRSSSSPSKNKILDDLDLTNDTPEKKSKDDNDEDDEFEIPNRSSTPIIMKKSYSTTTTSTSTGNNNEDLSSSKSSSTLSKNVTLKRSDSSLSDSHLLRNSVSASRLRGLINVNRENSNNVNEEDEDISSNNHNSGQSDSDDLAHVWKNIRSQSSATQSIPCTVAATTIVKSISSSPKSDTKDEQDSNKKLSDSTETIKRPSEDK